MTVVVTCNQAVVPEAETDRAVAAVFAADEDRRTQWLTITRIAPEFGMTPQMLRFWVQRAERARRA